MSMRTKLPVDWACWARLVAMLFGEGGIEREAHLGELDADVGVELARCDAVEKLVVDVGGLVSLGFGGDAFAERVEGDCMPWR